MPRRPPSEENARPRVVALAALLATELVAILVLVRLGRVAPFAIPWRLGAWSHAAPEDALAAALRWVALATAAWLFVVTVAYAFVTGRSAARWSTRWAPALIRRIVDGAVAASFAAAVVTGPTPAFAGTRDQPPVVTLVRDGRAGDLRSLPTDPSLPADSTAPAALATPEVSAAPSESKPPPVRTQSPPDAPMPAGSAVVAPGDNLWELAARAVARARGVPRVALADADVAPYWVVVCDADRERLQSRDVNLVLPGEVVELPPAS